MHEGNAALNYRKWARFGSFVFILNWPSLDPDSFQPKPSLVSCSLAKHVYLFLAHIHLCLGSCHFLCLECPLPSSPFPLVLSNSHLSSYMSQIKEHPFYKPSLISIAVRDFAFLICVFFCSLELFVCIFHPHPILQPPHTHPLKRFSPLRAENIYSLWFPVASQTISGLFIYIYPSPTLDLQAFFIPRAMSYSYYIHSI